jgi:hypothetical protein
MSQFDLEDAIVLLSGERAERFRLERAVRLYQLQVWTLFPNDDFYVAWAEMIAGVHLLAFLEMEMYCDETDAINRAERPYEASWLNLTDKQPQSLYRIATDSRRNLAYGALHDHVIAPLGGLVAVLYAPRPTVLQQEIEERLTKAAIATALFHYMVRYIKLQDADRNGGNLNHAKFFLWWPKRKRPKKKGVLSDTPSTKTMSKWWNTFNSTVPFLYLNEYCGFSQYPIDPDDEGFAEKLIKMADDVDQLRRFIGAYAYVNEAVYPERPSIVPISVARIPVPAEPLTADELATIRAYDANYTSMND